MGAMAVVHLRRTALVLGLAGLVAVSAACSSDATDAGSEAATADEPATTTAPTTLDDAIGLNQIQVIGSHNSYHVSNFDQIGDLSPAAVALDYTHDPLTEQLDGGLRSFELDIWLEDDGHLHVLHFPDFDPISTCDLFTECLTEIHDWSQDHPDHVPLGILVEVKVSAEDFGTTGIDQIDEDVRSVFAEGEVITPDDVRGDAATLAAAVPAGWPALAEARGQVMFAMDNEDDIRDLYTDGRPSLEGRMLFTSSAEGRPDAAFIKRNDPVADRAEIQRLVDAGYIIRTRADSDLLLAQNGDTTGRRAAFASGAQWVSTDYPATEPPAPNSGYTVAFPDGTFARCNPVNAPDTCDDAAVDPSAP